ncbi:hypothetical protein GCM10022244_31680 [Streptomyces gulbargensis]|uniref:Uncharacterized protein n=2 Tax=Streptomyces gulbargensis TaxID=364901 RepID=A0ABP7MCE1_9ACTN
MARIVARMASTSRTTPSARLVKALLVTPVAVAASHVVLSDTLRMGLLAQGASALGAGPGHSADQTFTTALVNTLLTMPVALWAGMRVTGERRLGPFVLTGTASWAVAVWTGLGRIDDVPGAVLPLPSLALVVAVTALSCLIRRPRRTGGT